MERLEKAGVPREQAKAEALAEVLSSGAQDLVTNERLEPVGRFRESEPPRL